MEPVVALLVLLVLFRRPLDEASPGPGRSDRRDPKTPPNRGNRRFSYPAPLKWCG